jgi:two-component system cell cycle response regulator
METRGREEGARILVVDDNEDNVDLLRTRLSLRGFRVEVARDGEEALEAIRRCPPDLVLLDVMMPRVDGLEVLRQVKSDPTLPFIPVILQTALDTTSDKIAGLDAGADDFLSKPLHFAELEARVRSLLRIKALQEELGARERELQRVNAQLLEMAQTDPLTQLDNRRHLEQRMRELFELSQRLNEPLSVVMCDLDRFKSVNDGHGHQAGDAVLRQLGALLRELARETDRVGRYGGEEFLLVLPGTVLDAAVTFGERVRRAVEAHTFEIPGGTLRRTLSCGVAAWPHPRVRTCDDVVRAADAALYVAKETGRNRVVRFDSQFFNAHPRADHAAHRDLDVPIDVPRHAEPADLGTRGEDRGAGGTERGAAAGA